jgi:hypothetical protein
MMTTATMAGRKEAAAARPGDGRRQYARQSVVARARVAKGTFYVHFSGYAATREISVPGLDAGHRLPAARRALKRFLRIGWPRAPRMCSPRAFVP